MTKDRRFCSRRPNLYLLPPDGRYSTDSTRREMRSHAGITGEALAFVISITYNTKVTVQYSLRKGLCVMTRTLDLKRPIPVQRAIRKLGQDIRDARRRRRLPTALVAERAGISRVTLSKLEKGDPGVSIGVIGSVLMALDLLDRLDGLADPQYDLLGRMLEEEQLPQRIRERAVKKE